MDVFTTLISVNTEVPDQDTAFTSEDEPVWNLCHMMSSIWKMTDWWGQIPLHEVKFSFVFCSSFIYSFILDSSSQTLFLVVHFPYTSLMTDADADDRTDDNLKQQQVLLFIHKREVFLTVSTLLYYWCTYIFHLQQCLKRMKRHTGIRKAYLCVNGVRLWTHIKLKVLLLKVLLALMN